jgi:hypothetical protein
MGNSASSPAAADKASASNETVRSEDDPEVRNKYKAFPGSAILEKTFCGSIDTTDPSEYEHVTLANRLLKRADILCVSSPQSTGDYQHNDILADNMNNNNTSSTSSSTRDRAGTVSNTNTTSSTTAGGSSKPVNASSALLARALVSEVTDNPKTMLPADMANREKKLMRAQQAAMKQSRHKSVMGSSRAIGAPGGVGPPAVLNSFMYAVTGDDTPPSLCVASGQNATNDSSMGDMATGGATTGGGGGPLQESRTVDLSAGGVENLTGGYNPRNPHAVTIGLSMSRRHAGVGNDATVTRQSAFDFNELQDRDYKYVSSTDATGWRAGGGEAGGPVVALEAQVSGDEGNNDAAQESKMAAPDLVHIPIIHLDCPDAATVDQVINALASGEIFIPHMTVLPEALSVSTGTPPDLVVRFGCERNDDLPADEWPNWCLEFMHNQLYEYFYAAGAKWNKRPFSITLAKKVRWKTVKHMNRYFAHAERVIESWREAGPQCLDPQLSYIQGGATPEEVAKPHGIYLLRNGHPTNYFAPNFEPPYTTKMTRSLLSNVLGKSWDKKRREWTAHPVPKLVTPSMLMAAACGCADPTSGGFMASEVTRQDVGVLQAPVHVHKMAVTDVEVSRSEVVLNIGEERDDNEDDDDVDDDDDDDECSAGPKQADEAEEKKTDDPMQAEGHKSSRSAPKSKSSGYNANNRSFESKATEDIAPSVAMSGTTVMHTNLTSNRLYSDEDWTSTATSPKSTKDAQAVLDREKAKAFSMQQAKSPNGRKLEPTDSGASLEYSTDGSSAFFNQDGSSPMFTTQFGADKKVQEDDGSALSIQDSASSVISVVPSDEELFAVGWAKAVDPSSGNYYYFTLDRSKTVWENPLTQSK